MQSPSMMPAPLAAHPTGLASPHLLTSSQPMNPPAPPPRLPSSAMSTLVHFSTALLPAILPSAPPQHLHALPLQHHPLPPHLPAVWLVCSLDQPGQPFSHTSDKTLLLPKAGCHTRIGAYWGWTVLPPCPVPLQ